MFGNYNKGREKNFMVFGGQYPKKLLYHLMPLFNRKELFGAYNMGNVSLFIYAKG